MSLPNSIQDREYQKFVEDVAGKVAIRVLLSGTSSLVDLTLSGNFFRSVETGITAGGSPQDQANAYALTKDSNWVDTVAVANDGVKLRAAAAGGSQIIVNESANTLKIYPATGDDLGAGTNNAIPLGAGGKIRFDAKDDTTWKAG